jgi:hypothetical protein
MNYLMVMFYNHCQKQYCQIDILTEKKIKKFLLIIILFITMKLLLRIRYLNCSNENIFKGLKIKSTEETLNEIIYNNKSISRFGDGEFLLTIGKNIPFQKYEKKIRDKLSEILLSKEQKLLVGLDLPYKNSYLKLLRNSSFNYWNNWFSKLFIIPLD